MKKTVLLADNHVEFLDTRAEYLELAGYTVVKARNPTQARLAITTGNVHLAILDLRLINDGDEGDKSGLEIARDPALRFVPSIIFTSFPIVDDVRNALRPTESSAIDYVIKKDGPQAMVEAVNNAFAKHVPINWDLVIQCDEESGLSIPGIIGMLEKNLPRDEFQARSDEVENLLRMAFINFDQVNLLRRLWIKNNRIALLAHARHNHADRFFVLTFGGITDIQLEITHQDLFPDVPSEGKTSFVHFKRRSHYAANLWRLSGATIDSLESLKDAFGNLKESQFCGVIENILKDTLESYRNQHEPHETPGSPADFYRNILPLCQKADANIIFQQRVIEISREARRLNLATDLFIEGGRLNISLTGHPVISLPDPSPLLFNKDGFHPGTFYYTLISPGRLDPVSILVGSKDAIWLTDFVQTGEFPVWHDFAQLETELRFSFIESNDLLEIYDLECQLRPCWPKIPHNSVNTNSEFRKCANAILRVREQAHGFHQSPLQYAQCLLFNSIAELIGNDPPNIHNRKDVARLIHRLLLAGLIAEDIFENSPNDPPIEYSPLILNLEEGFLSRGNVIIDLSDTEYRIITFLYESAGKSCDRKAICQKVFNITGEPTYNQLHGQIDSNINRLREKIEPNPDLPHYIITVHGRGIRLNIDPSKNT